MESSKYLKYQQGNIQYQQGSISVFIIFLGYVVWWFLEGNYRFPSFGAIRFEFLVGAVLTVLAFPTYFKSPNRERSGIGMWVTLFLITIVIMVPLSYAPEISYNIFIDRVLKYALFGFFIAAFVTTPKRLAFFMGAFLFACLKMGQEGFLGIITGSQIWEEQGIPRLHGSTPRYGHPNSFSGMALGSLPFCLYLFNLTFRYVKVLLVAQVIFAITIIIYTGSRTGYLGLIVGLLVLIWKAKNRKRAFFLLLIASGIIGFLLPQEYIERAQSIVTLQEKEGHSSETRIEILEDAMKIFLDRPFGIGVSAFMAARNARFGRYQDTHNLYLEIATNLGIQGLFAFIGLIVALLRKLFWLSGSISSQIKMVRQALEKSGLHELDIRSMKQHIWDLQVMDATCRSIFVFLLIRLTLGIFGHDLYEIYWWFVIGTTVAVWNINLIARRRTEALFACCRSTC